MTNRKLNFVFIIIAFVVIVLFLGCVGQKTTVQHTKVPNIQFTGFESGYERYQLIPFAIKVSDNETVIIESKNGTAIVSGVCSGNPNIQFTGFESGYERYQLILFAIKVSDNETVIIESKNGTAIVSGVCDDK